MGRASPAISVREPAFPGFCRVADAVRVLSEAGAEERGAVFTKREVVDFILDLAGYTPDKPLLKMRLLEPSFGGGDFLIPAIERLMAVWAEQGKPDPVAFPANCIRAVELHKESFQGTHEAIRRVLAASGVKSRAAQQIADQWLIYGDYLLAEIDGHFDVVVGNPPYVRQELIPDILMAEYRARYRTIYDRADIYIPFIERSLDALAKKGTLVFICADRWMKNRYGGPLRSMVASEFHLKAYIDMVDTPAFHSDVIAYPAITVITREKGGPTRITHRPRLDSEYLRDLCKAINAKKIPAKMTEVQDLAGIASGAEPWILDTTPSLALVRRIESAFPTLEEVGCKVGIGVATGDDKAFIGLFDELDVEEDRKLPLVMTRDIDGGSVKWRGYGVINPFADEGGLVDLRNYPRLRKFFAPLQERISQRHVAQKAPANWFRTIDRIYPALAKKPKLLIPDIKGAAHIVYEDEGLYPHHNLYFITSEDWDLRALRAVLLSGIARLFVSTYSTKMRGGYLRFQAQYLRRIRVPHWKDVLPEARKKLIDAAERGDVAACNEAAFLLYGLSEPEKAILGNAGGNGT